MDSQRLTQYTWGMRASTPEGIVELKREVDTGPIYNPEAIPN